MAFTSWSDMRDDLKDALADWASGTPTTREYQIGGRKRVFRDVQEIKDAITMTYEMEALESAGTPQNMVSYSRYRRG